jgi:hypothetical protein
MGYVRLFRRVRLPEGLSRFWLPNILAVGYFETTKYLGDASGL